MRYVHCAQLALPALVVLAACGHDEPARTTQVIVQPQPQAQPVVAAPAAPPPARSELVPPPPVGVGPVVWQPGHWLLSGNNWTWQPGQYVTPPAGETTWIPGQWVQQPAGGYQWLDGHWS
jgi:hypothetical protein